MSSDKFIKITWNQYPATKVMVAGPFDDWKGSTYEAKPTLANATNKSTLVPFEVCKPHLGPESQLVFKFIVDGIWTTSTAYQVVNDGQGNSNNSLDVGKAYCGDSSVVVVGGGVTSKMNAQSVKPSAVTEAAHSSGALIGNTKSVSVSTLVAPPIQSDTTAHKPLNTQPELKKTKTSFVKKVHYMYVLYATHCDDSRV